MCRKSQYKMANHSRMDTSQGVHTLATSVTKSMLSFNLLHRKVAQCTPLQFPSPKRCQKHNCTDTHTHTHSHTHTHTHLHTMQPLTAPSKHSNNDANTTSFHLISSEWCHGQKHKSARRWSSSQREMEVYKASRRSHQSSKSHIGHRSPQPQKGQEKSPAIQKSHRPSLPSIPCNSSRTMV